MVISSEKKNIFGQYWPFQDITDKLLAIPHVQQSSGNKAKILKQNKIWTRKNNTTYSLKYEEITKTGHKTLDGKARYVFKQAGFSLITVPAA